MQHRRPNILFVIADQLAGPALPAYGHSVVQAPQISRIVRTAGSLPGPGGQRLEFATEYSAFQKFSGVLFATHEESWARGQHTGATQLTRVEVLARAPEGAFDEPL